MEEEIKPNLTTTITKKEKKVKEKKVKEKVVKEKVVKEKVVKEKKVKEINYNERPLVLKVSEKKAVSIYGMNRFPITLYKDQLIRLLEHSQEIYDFIEKNKEVLATKKNKEEEEEI
jgi:hypothetical protein